MSELTRKRIQKYSFLLFSGGLAYILIELMYRQRTHWTMFFVGGACFIGCGLINNLIDWNMYFEHQMIIGASLVTCVELVFGIIINLILQWNVWDYSNMRFNFKGQICLEYFPIWMLISAIAIIFDDWLRWKFCHEQKPEYRSLVVKLFRLK